MPRPLSLDGVRPETAEPQADPPPQIPNHPLDPLVLVPDPLVTALRISNAIWLAVHGPRGR